MTNESGLSIEAANENGISQPGLHDLAGFTQESTQANLEKLIKRYLTLPNGELGLMCEMLSPREGAAPLPFIVFEWSGQTLSGRDAGLTIRFQVLGEISPVLAAGHVSSIVTNFLNQYDEQEKANVSE